MKVLFLVPYPIGHSPSQRFRFEQYFRFLKESAIEYRISTFLTVNNWRLFYDRGNTVSKFVAIAGGLIRRVLSLVDILKYDFVFIHREAAPFGPPVLEWIISKVFRRKIIYDFDDAIWLTDKKNESRFEKMIRWRSKVSSICKWSHKVSAGNAHLVGYARAFCQNVILNPTTIDIESVHKPVPKKTKDGRVVIGWTGSHSTLKYLKELEGILKSIEKTWDRVEFSVIADKAPDLDLARFQFRPWSVETEILDLSNFDIGIMPMPDDPWTQGKCGFKALQYMAMEIPTIASPVGVNSTIIQHGKNGFLAPDLLTWEDLLSRLIVDAQLRREMGREGRKTVEEKFSVTSNRAKFVALFE